MRNIIVIALLLTLVLASFRGAERKENHQDREAKWGRGDHKQRRHDESSVSQSYSESNESESGSDSYSGPSNYSSNDDEYSGSSDYSAYSDYESDYSGSQDYSGYDDSEYSGPSDYSNDSDDSDYSDEYEYSSDSDEYSGSYSESSDSSESEEQEQQERHRGRREFGRGKGKRMNCKHNKNNGPHPQDEFPRVVFKTLRQTGKVILEEWNVIEDPVLKNEIRTVLIQNLENLLPIAEISVNPVDPINSIGQTQEEKQQPHRPNQRPPHPPPKPEDEFAQLVFETLHQIGFDILEQWNVQQDVEQKNQIRADLIQRLNDLIPVQQVVEPTIILDQPIDVTNVPNARLTEEDGN